MRILHTGHSYYPSADGVAEVIRHVSELLALRGHEVHVATGALDRQSSNTTFRGVHIHRFAVKGRLATGMDGDVTGYREFVRSGGWDILVNHCISAWPTDALLDEIRAYPWPSILVTHGLNLADRRFEAYFRDLPEYLRSYCRWVRVSHSTEELPFATKFNLPIPSVISNGVDIQEWTRTPIGMRQLWGIGGEPWIVNVSNHYGKRHKNHPMLFELARRLKQSGARVTLIGNSHPMSKWNLGALGVRGGCYYGCRARALVSRSVELRTNLPREQVVSAIQEADLMVSASCWEANSVVLLESMAAGTAWVSTDVGSARELTGGVVAHSLCEMEKAVVELLGNPGRRRSLGKLGRTRAIAKHDWEGVANQYERLYENCIGSPTNSCVAPERS